MEVKDDDFQVMTFIAENQDLLLMEIDDWEKVMTFTGWYNFEYVSIVFSRNAESLQAILTCKITVDPDAFTMTKTYKKVGLEKPKENNENDLPF